MPEETTAERVERIRAERDAARAQALTALTARVHGLGDDALAALVLLAVALDNDDARPELQRLAAVAVGEWHNRKGDDGVAALYEEVEG